MRKRLIPGTGIPVQLQVVNKCFLSPAVIGLGCITVADDSPCSVELFSIAAQEVEKDILHCLWQLCIWAHSYGQGYPGEMLFEIMLVLGVIGYSQHCKQVLRLFNLPSECFHYFSTYIEFTFCVISTNQQLYTGIAAFLGVDPQV